MTYGLQIFNDNDNILIDTSKQSQMQITQQTTHASGTDLVAGSGEFILWNTVHSGGGFTLTAFTQDYGDTDITNGHSTITFNVLRLREVTQATPPTRPANDYGIETYNASSTVSYSDLFTKSYDILAIYPPGTLTNDSVLYTGSTTDVYAGAGQPNHFGGGGYSASFGNFAFASNSIKYKSYINVPYIGFFQAFPNASTVIILKVRN
jgi:hypothetical protein